MFTGLIETTGIIRRLVRKDGGIHLAIEPSTKPFDIAPGDSLAVNGVCLTLERAENTILFFTAVAETLRATNFTTLKLNQRVNLERALSAKGRLDGHIVQGHVDVTGTLRAIKKNGESLHYHFSVPRKYEYYIASKGSVAIDGISLTVAGVQEGGFSVALIPYTINHTSLQDKKPGDTVNIECDILAKYTERLLEKTQAATKNTTEKNSDFFLKLKRSGF
jgi:riboflavin synthase